MRKRNTKYKWSDTSKENFIQQIDLNEVSHLKANIDEIEPNYENINFYTNKISSLFEQTARISLNSEKRFGTKGHLTNRGSDRPVSQPEKNITKQNECINRIKMNGTNLIGIRKVKTLKKF